MKIHINQHKIRSNRKNNEKEPVITVKGKTNTYCDEVEIDGPSKVVYSPDKPLSCGATVWIQVDKGVKVKMKRNCQKCGKTVDLMFGEYCGTKFVCYQCVSRNGNTGNSPKSVDLFSGYDQQTANLCRNPESKLPYEPSLHNLKEQHTG